MTCPLFIDGRDCRCLAVAGPHAPTLHERERYCRTPLSARCPTWRAYRDLGVRLSEDQYLQIWIPPRPSVSTAYTH